MSTQTPELPKGSEELKGAKESNEILRRFNNGQKISAQEIQSLCNHLQTYLNNFALVFREDPDWKAYDNINAAISFVKQFNDVFLQISENNDSYQNFQGLLNRVQQSYTTDQAAKEFNNWFEIAGIVKSIALKMQDFAKGAKDLQKEESTQQAKAVFVDPLILSPIKPAAKKTIAIKKQDYEAFMDIYSKFYNSIRSTGDEYNIAWGKIYSWVNDLFNNPGIGIKTDRENSFDPLLQQFEKLRQIVMRPKPDTQDHVEFAAEQFKRSFQEYIRLAPDQKAEQEQQSQQAQQQGRVQKQKQPVQDKAGTSRQNESEGEVEIPRVPLPTPPSKMQPPSV